MAAAAEEDPVVLITQAMRSGQFSHVIAYDLAGNPVISYTPTAGRNLAWSYLFTAIGVFVKQTYPDAKAVRVQIEFDNGETLQVPIPPNAQV